MQQSEGASQEQERSQSGYESMQGEQEEAASQQEAASPSADGSADGSGSPEEEPEASQDVSGDAPGSPSVSGQSRSDVQDASVSELTDGQEAAGYRGSRKRASRDESPSTAQRSSKVARATRSSAEEPDDSIDAATAAAALAAEEDFPDMEVHPALVPEVTKPKPKSDPFKIRRDADADLDPEPDLDLAVKEAQEALLEEIKAQEQREARQQPAGRQSTPQATANVISDVVDFLRLAAAQDPSLMSKIDFATLCTSGYKYNTMWSRMERIVRSEAASKPLSITRRSERSRTQTQVYNPYADRSRGPRIRNGLSYQADIPAPRTCKEGAPGPRKPSKEEAKWISKKVYTPEKGYKVPKVLPPPDSIQWRNRERLQPPYDNSWYLSLAHVLLELDCEMGPELVKELGVDQMGYRVTNTDAWSVEDNKLFDKVLNMPLAQGAEKAKLYMKVVKRYLPSRTPAQLVSMYYNRYKVTRHHLYAKAAWTRKVMGIMPKAQAGQLAAASKPASKPASKARAKQQASKPPKQPAATAAGTRGPTPPPNSAPVRPYETQGAAGYYPAGTGTGIPPAGGASGRPSRSAQGAAEGQPARGKTGKEVLDLTGEDEEESKAAAAAAAASAAGTAQGGPPGSYPSGYAPGQPYPGYGYGPAAGPGRSAAPGGYPGYPPGYGGGYGQYGGYPGSYGQYGAPPPSYPGGKYPYSTAPGGYPGSAYWSGYSSGYPPSSYYPGQSGQYGGSAPAPGGGAGQYSSAPGQYSNPSNPSNPSGTYSTAPAGYSSYPGSGPYPGSAPYPYSSYPPAGSAPAGSAPAGGTAPGAGPSSAPAPTAAGAAPGSTMPGSSAPAAAAGGQAAGPGTSTTQQQPGAVPAGYAPHAYQRMPVAAPMSYAPYPGYPHGLTGYPSHSLQAAVPAGLPAGQLQQQQGQQQQQQQQQQVHLQQGVTVTMPANSGIRIWMAQDAGANAAGTSGTAPAAGQPGSTQRTYMQPGLPLLPGSATTGATAGPGTSGYGDRPAAGHAAGYGQTMPSGGDGHAAGNGPSAHVQVARAAEGPASAAAVPDAAARGLPVVPPSSTFAC